jgi:hypothetical protein
MAVDKKRYKSQIQPVRNQVNPEWWGYTAELVNQTPKAWMVKFRYGKDKWTGVKSVAKSQSRWIPDEPVVGSQGILTMSPLAYKNHFDKKTIKAKRIDKKMGQVKAKPVSDSISGNKKSRYMIDQLMKAGLTHNKAVALAAYHGSLGTIKKIKDAKGLLKYKYLKDTLSETEAQKVIDYFKGAKPVAKKVASGSVSDAVPAPGKYKLTAPYELGGPPGTEEEIPPGTKVVVEKYKNGFIMKSRGPGGFEITLTKNDPVWKNLVKDSLNTIPAKVVKDGCTKKLKGVKAKKKVMDFGGNDVPRKIHKDIMSEVKERANPSSSRMNQLDDWLGSNVDTIIEEEGKVNQRDRNFVALASNLGMDVKELAALIEDVYGEYEDDL